jgi:alanine-glyoxylate transaminase/serine-glyoxylate transaminase/serine-pyruvate transaminase
MTSTPSLEAPARVLLGPGPSTVNPRVLRAMSIPLVGHLDPAFLRIMDETKRLLQFVFQTRNELTIPISGTGSAGMEACLVNLLESGDEAVVCINGVFGTRMADIVERCGATLVKVEAPWGRVVEPAAVAAALRRCARPKLLGIVHAETSTGAWQPLEEISELVHGAGALLLVDTVTSLGGHPVQVDDWGIDVCYSGTQKCLSCPPGLSPITFGPRAVEALHRRKTKVQSWYLDLTMIERYWGAERVYHHTAPISMNYALYEALRIIEEEGLAARWARHQRNHEALKAGLAAIGLTIASQESHQLWTLNSVRIPDGVDDARLRSALLDEFNIEIGGGLGPLKGKTWRIGLMGESSTAANVLLVLSALERVLPRCGHAVSAGAALAAAQRVYAPAPQC